MGILRSDLLTHSQLSNEGGSIVLDGSGDYLSFSAHSFLLQRHLMLLLNYGFT